MSFDRHNTNIYLLTNYTNNVRNTWQPTHTHTPDHEHTHSHTPDHAQIFRNENRKIDAL